MKKIYADKSLDITEEDKFEKPSNWTGGCGDLQGLGGYGDEGGLQTIEEIRNPKSQEPSNNSAPRSNNAPKKEENLNENLNQGDEIDFNQ